jgi:hypothetical protein
MVLNYKIPAKEKKPNEKTSTAEQPFTIEMIVHSLANNKHNDHTTTYYLLHKKWLTEMSEEDDETIKAAESQLITLSPQNY